MTVFPRIPRPEAGEHSADRSLYINAVDGDDAWAALTSQMRAVERLFASMSEDRALFRYAPGKWSVKEVLGHLCDTERVYAYRALRFARNDATPLEGFDENRYVPAGRFDARPVAEILEEWRAVRSATLALFRGLEPDAMLRQGVANGSAVSVRALAWLAVGHAQHHLGVLRKRYGLS